MILTVYGKQMTVRDSLREAIERKLEKFDKFFGTDADAYVTCRVRKGVKIIEITITYAGTMFRSEEESDTFLTALDRACEGLERQIRKNKTRLEKRVKQGAFVMTSEDDDEFEEEKEFHVRTKSFSIKPMSVEEAILQMNLLKHDFYVFYHDETDKTCVVYRRRDGDYGLIVPND